jgi:hypothetical protein
LWLQEQLHAQSAADKAQIGELMAARKEAEKLVSLIAEEHILALPKLQSQAWYARLCAKRQLGKVKIFYINVPDLKQG